MLKSYLPYAFQLLLLIGLSSWTTNVPSENCTSENDCLSTESNSYLSLATYEYEEVGPVWIPDNGCFSNNNAEIQITIPDAYLITDINVGLTIQHAYAADIEVTIIAPDGSTSTELFSDVGSGSDNFDVLLDSDIATNISAKAGFHNITNGTFYEYSFSPETANALDVFNGMMAAGTWTIQVCDDANGDAGNILRAKLFLEGVPPSGPGFSNCTNSDQIGGIVYEDYDGNGEKDGTEPFYPNASVSIHDDNGQVGASQMTNSNGEYLFSGLTTGATYRVEFTSPADMEFGALGNTTGSNVQFVTTGACNVSTGVLSPEFYCPGTPEFTTTCFVDGEPLSGGTSGNLDVLVTAPVTASGNSNPDVSAIAINSDMGTVWGAAYDKTSETIYTSAFLKRHAGFGPLGIGGIYSVDYSTPATPIITNWLDVNTLSGVNVGSDPRNYNLPANTAVPHNDPSAFGNIGKVGIGDIDISSDQKTLYLMNLDGNGELIGVDIATKTKTIQVAVPNPGCGSAFDVRPFAVKAYKNEVYIGLVCSGQAAGLADMHFYIMKLNGNAFVTVADGDLNYIKGNVHNNFPNDCDNWETWTDAFSDIHTIGTTIYGDRWCRPQPMLTDIEFDLNDDMIIGFADRAGHQLGYQQWGTSGNSSGNGYSGGDLLRLYNNNGTYVLENNGTTTIGGGCGVNNQGPGTGEYYCGEYFDAIHEETSLGGVAVRAYTNEVIVSSMDPTTTWGGGVVWMDNITGAKTQGLQLYNTTGGSSGTYGKGAGIGDVELLCPPAPLALGNYVWIDQDGDGIQDPSEPVVSNVLVSLTDVNDNVVSTTFTNVNGNYIFDDSNVAGGIDYNTDYKIKIALADALAANSALSGLTVQNAGNGHNDNDAILNGNNAEVTLNSGSPGATTYSIDFGFLPSSAVGNYIWMDEDGDGDQDAGEQGIAGIAVELQSANCTSGVDCPIEITDANGGYIFKNVDPGIYTVAIFAGVPNGLNLIYDEDNGTSSPDGNISVTVNSGDEYVIADFGYNWNPKTDTDGPASMTAPGVLGDRVWSDADGDGVQDPAEVGIANVTITLYEDADNDGLYDDVYATTTTDANGNYIFTNLPPAAYVIEVEESDLTGFNIIPTKDPDNDANNISELIVIAPGDVWIGGDFGYQSTGAPADIGNFVWMDFNEDGIKDANEPGIPGVTVSLENVSGVPIASSVTDANGNYIFPDLQSGNYTVVITDTEYVLDALKNTSDPDNGTAEESDVALGAADDMNQNFGYVPNAHSAGDALLGDFVFLDMNGNSLFTPGEPGIEGVNIELMDDASGNVISTTKTNENGAYYFGGLAAGDYRVRLDQNTVPSGLTMSVDPDGSIPANNESDIVTLAAGDINLFQDFGLKAVTPYSIDGTVWEDVSAEGMLDAGEINRFENVNLWLLDTNGTRIASTTTAPDGTYSFNGLPNGIYTVEVVDDLSKLESYWHSLGLDSESDPKMVTISGANVTDVDFGYYADDAAIGNLVWIDYNSDGIQDANEPGLEGALVLLEIDYDGGGTDLTVRMRTDMDGKYGFQHLLLDEDYNGDGVGIEPIYTLKVIAPNAETMETLMINAGTSKEDSEDHDGIVVQPTLGLKDLTKMPDPNSETDEASYDFAFDFDCTHPSVEYAITLDASNAGASQTTNYFVDVVSGDTIHQAMTQTDGIIRSNAYCEFSGWRYYYNPLDPDEYLFAIEMGNNVTEIDHIELTIDDAATDRYSAGTNDATYVMIRNWSVKTVDNAPLLQANASPATVNVRFYFPPGEYQQMLDAAKAQATTWGVGTPNETMVEWFNKSDFDPATDIDDANTILSAYDMTTLRNATTSATGSNTPDNTPAIGNAKNHIQFNNATEIPGGTAMIHINRSALPVELIGFAVQPNDCHVVIDWTTTSEVRFDAFQIERSFDGNNFEQIGVVKGLGDTGSQHYEFIDQNAMSDNYYRLKMVDLDGSFEYTRVLQIQIDCIGEQGEMIVYPNPIAYTAGDINVKFKSSTKDGEMIVTNVLGSIVRQISFSDLDSGWNLKQISIDDLPSGTYYIHLDSYGERRSKAFVIQQ